MISYADRLCSVGATAVGLALLYNGGSLTAYEARMSGRYLLGETNQQSSEKSNGNESYSLKPDEIQNSELAARILRSEVYKGSPPTEAKSEEARLETEFRITALAETLVSLSPLDAYAWCILAISDARTHGLTDRAAQRLRACFKFAPFEDWIADWRISLALASWHDLPRDLRLLALTEIARRLAKPELQMRTAQHLAYVVSTIAPQQSSLVLSLIALSSEPVKTQFQRTLKTFQPK